MTVTKLVRLEVWTEAEAAGGARIAFLPEFIAPVRQRELDGEIKLSLRIPAGAPGAEEIQEKRILRSVYAGGTWEEWRIDRLLRERAADETTALSVEAVDIRFDLAARGRVAQVQSNGQIETDFDLTAPISDHLVLILSGPDVPAYFAAGTVEGPDDEVTIAYGGETPLAALLALSEEAERELDVTFDGAVYRVHLVEAVGSAAPIARLRYAKNILGISRDVDTTQLATRVYPRGGEQDGFSLTIADALWEITAINAVSRMVTLADYPIAFSDQLNGLTARRYGTEALLDVQDTLEQTQQVQLSSVAGLVVGDYLQFRDPTGRELIYLDRPNSVAMWGLFAPPDAALDRSIPPVNNLLREAFLDAAVLAHWAAVGGAALARVTDRIYTRYGLASRRVTCAGDGQGIESAWQTVVPIPPVEDGLGNVVGEGRPYFCAQVALWIASGSVRLELDVDTAGDGSVVVTLPDSGRSAVSNETGIWIDSLSLNADLATLGAKRVRLRLVQSGTAATVFYLDAAQLTQTHSGAAVFYDQRAANELWRAGLLALAEYGTPRLTYETEILDLHRQDPTAFAADEIVVGGTVQLVDQELGIDTLARVQGVTQELAGEGRTQVTVSTRPPALVELIQRERARRRRAIGRTPAPPTVAWMQYASDASGTNLSSEFDPLIHIYARISTDGGATWTDWYRMKGDPGEGLSGQYLELRWRVSTTQPATPTGTNPTGWFTAPPAVDPGAGERLWMSRIWRNPDGTIVDGEVWSTPVQISGPQGPTGPNGPKGDPGDDLVPLATITSTARVLAAETLEFSAAVGPAGVGPLHHAVRSMILGNSVTPAWPAWSAAAPASPAEYFVSMKFTRLVEYKVLDTGTGRESAVASFLIEPRNPALDDTTGRVKRSVPLDDDALIEDVTSAQLKADQAELDANAETTARGLASTGAFSGSIDGETAVAVKRQALASAQNLLGPTAGNEVSGTFTINLLGGATSATAVQLTALGLTPGDEVSWLGEIRSALGAATNLRLGTQFWDDANVLVGGTSTPYVQGSAYQVARYNGYPIPATATKVRLFLTYTALNGDTIYARRVMMNRGPRALPFEYPPFRVARERANDLPAGNLPTGVKRYDGGDIESVTAAQAKADQAEIDANAETTARGLATDGFGGPVKDTAAFSGGRTAWMVGRAVGRSLMLETFDAIPPGMSSSVGVSIISGGRVGANRMQVDNAYRYWYGPSFPFDPNALYRVRVGFQVLQDNTDLSPNELIYAGFRHAGGNAYFVASVLRYTVAEGYVELTGWLKGTGAVIQNARDPLNPSGLGAAETYWQPMMLINYSSPTGQIMAIDYFAVDVYDEDAATRLYSALETDGGVVRGKALKNVPALDSTSGRVRKAEPLLEGGTIEDVAGAQGKADQAELDAESEITARGLLADGTGGGIKYGTGVTIDGLRPAAPGADVTADNRALGARVQDRRGVNQPPSYYGVGTTHEFKARADIGAPGTTVYGYLSTEKQWPDSSGGYATQTFKSVDGVFERKGPAGGTLATDWGPWRTTEDTSGAQTKATIAETNAESEVSARGLAPTGNFTGSVDGIIASTVRGGAQRANAGLDAVGDVQRNVPRSRAAANLPAIHLTTGLITRTQTFHEGGTPEHEAGAQVRADLAETNAESEITARGLGATGDFTGSVDGVPAADVNSGVTKAHSALPEVRLLAGDVVARYVGSSLAGGMLKGLRTGSCFHGQPISFAYESVPVIQFPVNGVQQGWDRWGTKAAVDAGTANGAPPPSGYLVRSMPSAKGVSASGFTADLVIIAQSEVATTAKSLAFTNPTITAVNGQTSNATPLDVDTPAVGNAFSVQGYLSIDNTGIGAKRETGSAVVALFVRINGGAIVEVASATLNYDVLIDDTAELPFTLSCNVDVDGGDDYFFVRVKSKSAFVASATWSVTASPLTWGHSSAAFTYASMTPDGAVDALPYFAFVGG